MQAKGGPQGRVLSIDQSSVPTERSPFGFGTCRISAVGYRNRVLAWPHDSEARVQGRKRKAIQQGSITKETCRMFALSVVGGLLLVGYSISRVRAKQSEKPDVQTLFSKK
jgi:hypothetical protein